MKDGSIGYFDDEILQIITLFERPEFDMDFSRKLKRSILDRLDLYLQRRASSRKSVVIVDNKFAAYIDDSPVRLEVDLKQIDLKTYSSAIDAFGPAFIRSDSSTGLWEWHFDDGTVITAPPIWRTELENAIEFQVKQSNNLNTLEN